MKKTMKLFSYDRPYDELDRWQELCPKNQRRRLSPTQFYGVLPDDLLDKTNTVLVMSSDSSDASVYVANIYRVDPEASAIDQEPYIVTFNHRVSIASGYFVNHGDWDDRTIHPDTVFFEAIAASGIDQHYPYESIPPGSAGPMSDLMAHQEAADFWNEMKKIRSRQIE